MRDFHSIGTIGIAELRAALADLGMTAAAPAAPAVTLSPEQAAGLAAVLGVLGDLARQHGEPELAARTAAFEHLLTRPAHPPGE